MRFLFFLLLTINTCFGQDYSRTPTKQPYTTIQAAKSAIPKSRQAGQSVWVKMPDRQYILTAEGNALPADGLFRVEDFRDSGETDSQVWQQAVDGIPEGAVLHAYSRAYRFDRPVNIRKSVQIIAEGTVIANGSPYQRIDTETKPDLSYPAATDPGPMKGCAFYCTGLVYNFRIQGIDFNSFRFGIAFLDPFNSPVFNRCSFSRCNVGIFCYRGSQNYQIISCSSFLTGCLYASSATCFPEGSPYAHADNHYTDGLTVDGKGGFINGIIQPAFDNWFRQSILRPDVRSFAAGNNDLKDNEGITYNCGSDLCNITGRGIYVPMRQFRIIFNPHLENLDSRNGCERGIALLNSTCEGLWISGSLNFEGVFSSASGPAFFTIGSATSGNISSPFLAYDAGQVHNFVDFTGRGPIQTGFEKISWNNNWYTGSFKIDALVRGTKRHCIGIIGEAYNSGVLDFQIRDSHTVADVAGQLANATLYIEDGPDNIPLAKVYAGGRPGQENSVMRFLPGPGAWERLRSKRAVMVW